MPNCSAIEWTSTKYIVYLPDAPRTIRSAFGNGDTSELGSRNNTLNYLPTCLFGLTFFSLLINSNSSIFMAIFSGFHKIYHSLSCSFICTYIFLSFNQHENQHCKKYVNTPNWELPRGDYVVVVFSSSLIKKQKTKSSTREGEVGRHAYTNFVHVNNNNWRQNTKSALQLYENIYVYGI